MRDRGLKATAKVMTTLRVEEEDLRRGATNEFNPVFQGREVARFLFCRRVATANSIVADATTNRFSMGVRGLKATAKVMATLRVEEEAVISQFCAAI
jgi:hypothetical protein